jgi:hypothetical protein
VKKLISFAFIPVLLALFACNMAINNDLQDPNNVIYFPKNDDTTVDPGTPGTPATPGDPDPSGPGTPPPLCSVVSGSSTCRAVLLIPLT